MQKYEVLFYDLSDGTEPAKEFLLGLDTKMRAKMARTIVLLGSYGQSSGNPTPNPWEMASLSCAVRLAVISPASSISL